MSHWESDGLHPADFWRSTPRQIVASLKARENLLVREKDLAIMQAYYTAGLTRWNSKKKPYPKLDSLLVAGGSMRRSMTVEEQWQRMISISSTRKAMN